MSVELLEKLEKTNEELNRLNQELTGYEEEFQKHLDNGSLIEADKYRILLITLRHERDEHLLDIYHTEYELKVKGPF